MKRVTLILGVLVIAALSSCSKEKDCRCVTDFTGTGSEQLADVTVTTTIDKGDCSDLNTTTTTFGLVATMTCTEQ